MKVTALLMLLMMSLSFSLSAEELEVIPTYKVNMYTASWCGPCHQLKTDFAQFGLDLYDEDTSEDYIIVTNKSGNQVRLKVDNYDVDEVGWDKLVGNGVPELQLVKIEEGNESLITDFGPREMYEIGSKNGASSFKEACEMFVTDQISRDQP